MDNPLIFRGLVELKELADVGFHRSLGDSTAENLYKSLESQGKSTLCPKMGRGYTEVV
jgi:hypothetical protein